MKTMQMKAGLLCAAAMALGGVARGETYTLTSVRDDTETFAVGTCWSGGIAPTDDAAAGHDFVVLLSGIRTTQATLTAFKCNSLTIGGAGNFVQLYFKEDNWSFPETSEGLKLVRAWFRDWTEGTRTYTIAGPVTFADDFSKTAEGRYAAEFFPEAGKTASTVVHDFTGKVTASADARIRNYRLAYDATKRYGLRFSGDATAFYGTVEIGQSARFELGATTLPGTIKLSTETSELAPQAGTAGFTAGTLDLAANATLELALDRTAGTAQKISVTDRFAAAGPVCLRLTEKFGGEAVDARDYEVLFVSKDAEGYADVSADTFVVTPPVGASEEDFRIDLVEDAAGKHVFFHRLPVIRHETGEYMGSDTNVWSDHVDPHGGADYWSRHGVLRFANMGTTIFPGNSLTFSCNSMTPSLVLQCYEQTITNVYVRSKHGLCLANWHQGDKWNSATLSKNGIKFVSGNFHLLDGGMIVQSTVPIHLVSDAFVEGAHGVSFKHLAGADNEVYLELKGTNDFLGAFTVIDTDGATHRSFLVLHDAGSLGGNPTAFQQKGVYVGNNATLWVRDTTALDAANRGFAWGDAIVKIDADKTFAVKTPAFAAAGATLRKTGDGTLALAGALDVSANANPVVSVEAGGVQAGAKGAFEGATVAFSGTGALVAAVSAADADVATYGLRNVSAQAPFTLGCADGKLHVAIADWTAGTRRADVALCTVSAAAAEGLRGKFAFAGLESGLLKRVVEKTIDEGTVTFVLQARAAGTALFVR